MPWLSVVFIPFACSAPPLEWGILIFVAYVKSLSGPDRRVEAALLKDHRILNSCSFASETR